MKENPSWSAKELTDFGNQILLKEGYDYTFDWTPKGKENKANLPKAYTKDTKDYYPFKYQFTDIKGKLQPFQLMNDSFEHPCFSVIDIPVIKVNKKTMTVISEGKKIELKRPKDFYLEEFVLVDKDMKRVIRKWQVPIDATPFGISNDGKKVYFESWEFFQDETAGYKEKPIKLAIEVSEDGSLKFVTNDSADIIKNGEDFRKPQDLKPGDILYKSGESSFMLFKSGEKEFIINFPYVCT